MVFSRNLIRDNAGAGILVMSANGTTITQNSFSNNGGLSIDLDPRSIDPNGLGAPQGVTINDNGDSDAGPNGLRNFPVMVPASLIGTELSLGGFARPGSAIELYIAQADPTGFGEGLTYLGCSRKDPRQISTPPRAPTARPTSTASRRAPTTPIDSAFASPCLAASPSARA